MKTHIKRALVFTKKTSTLVTKGRALLQIEKKGRDQGCHSDKGGRCTLKKRANENTACYTRDDGIQVIAKTNPNPMA